MIYAPREDSFLLEKQVKRFAKNKKVLDMGSGSGIQVKAAQSVNAKSVLAADINPEAVNNLQKQNIPAIKSNLFSKIREKFDLIIFNPPYLPMDKREDKESQLATTGGKRGDEVIVKFLKGIKKHLAEKGMILLVVSSLTPKDRVSVLLEKQKLRHRVLSSEKLFFETLEVWQITE